MSNKLEVTILIVSYNTKEEILACLSSLKKITYPKDKYKVVIFDNNSTDLSEISIRKKYPEIPFIAYRENIGFAAAVNAVISKIDTPFFVLLNPDTVVTKNWLTTLVKRIKSSEKIAAVNSLTYLEQKFTDYTVSLDPTEKPSEDIYYHLHGNDDVHLLHSNQELYKDGFIPLSQGLSFIEPIRDQASSLVLENRKATAHTLHVQQGKKISTISLPGKGFQKVELQSDYSYFVVQNAGNIIFKSGYSRDRGAVVSNLQQIYYPDAHVGSYFHKPTPIQAISGVSCIIRTSAFKEVGMFDPRYFMYYEDIDLSIRLRKSGYTLYFEPESVLYHAHSVSSQEWSPFFRYHTEKGRLLLLLKHFPLYVFAWEYFIFIQKTTTVALKLLKYKLRNYWELADTTSLEFQPKKNTVLSIARECFNAVKNKNELLALLKNIRNNKIYSESL